ncbi:MAG: hypothetical protein U0228_14205 [Myxococcaceae bacterium]
MNPTGQPFNPNPGGMPPPAGSSSAQQELNVPGLLLMIFGALSALMAVWGLISSFLMSGESNAMLSKMMDDPNFPPAAKQMVATMMGSGGKAVILIVSLIRMAVSGLLVFGGFQMRNLKGYGLAMATAAIALLPCNGCCCVTLPVGIWALVTLMKPEVKSQFT